MPAVALIGNVQDIPPASRHWMKNKNNAIVPPAFSKPRPATPINNPITGTPVFGMFPELSVSGVEFAAGPIYLRFGAHFGANRGWGFEHIWQGHFASCLTFHDAEPKVTGLLNSIVVPGATIHYEYGLGKAEKRSTVFRSAAGVVVVERMTDGGNQVFYSVVTAFPARMARGYVIGRL
jgi:hypothetical protein